MNKLAKVLGVILGLGIVTATVLLLFGNVSASNQGADVPEYEVSGDTLIRYNGSDNAKVTVPDGVKIIGDDAFSGHTEITDIALPDSVEKIGFQAFKNTGIQSMTVPNSVMEISSSAFENCDNLTSVKLGSGLEKIGNGLFTDCDNLSEIKCDESNGRFMFFNGALYNGNMTNLYQILKGAKQQNITIPSTVESMSPYAGYGLSSLVNLSTGSNLKTIPSYAFSECDRLLTVTMSGNTNEIEMKAFAGNDSLAQVYIPQSVSTIHATAFDNCPNLSILAKEDGYAEKYANQNNITFITKPIYDVAITTENSSGDGSTASNGNAAENSSSQNTGSKTDYNGYNDGTGVDSDGTFTTKIVGDRAVILIDNTSVDVDYGSNLRDEEFVDSSIIPAKSHWGETELTDYNIDKMVKTIEEFAFARSGLKSITIPSNVSRIEKAAFYHCDDLERVYVSDNVTYIGPYVFSYTKWMKDFLGGTSENPEDDYLIVGDGILIAYRGNGEVLTIPEGTKRIASVTFENNTNIKTVNLPTTLIEIGEEAFYGCSKLSEVNGLNQSIKIGNGAFSGTLVTAE